MGAIGVITLCLLSGLVGCLLTIWSMSADHKVDLEKLREQVRALQSGPVE